MAGREMLDRWAATLSDRRLVEDFLEYAERRRVVLSHLDGPNGSSEAAGPLLDGWLDIDQKQLERDRAALLDEHRAATGQNKP